MSSSLERSMQISYGGFYVDSQGTKDLLKVADMVWGAEQLWSFRKFTAIQQLMSLRQSKI